ncbi:MAG: hypothetical protein KDK97_05880 [Verrucomicrobiales bacterium]|nr:hypothetical protein [Verrucomicrobiales bacterium]MCP5560028.1 hypothetical protein [Verrucomicrobiaceae bacterium]
MKGRSSGSLLIILVVMLVALYAIVDLLLTSGNMFSRLSLMIMIPCALAGLAARRTAMVLFLISCGYVDLLKRLLVVDGQISKLDLYYVLGIPPITLGAILVSTLAGAMSGSVKIRSRQWTWLALAVAMMGVTIIAQVRETGWGLGQLLPALANSAFYTVIVFLVPVLFPTMEDSLAMLKKVLLCYVPVALYGMYQQVHGFQDFEIAYLLTGLSIEIKQLVYGEVRAFSTLNSPTALGAVTMILAVLSIVLTQMRHTASGRPFLGKAVGVFLFCIFVGGWLSSTSRSAAVILLMGAAGWWCFSSGPRTFLAYFTGVTGMLMLMVFAESLLDHLRDASLVVYDIFGSNKFGEQLTRLGTFTERLQGFSNLLKNPEFLTAFGYGADRGIDPSDPLYNHDLLSNLIVRFGLVPVGIGSVIAVWVAVWLHTNLLQIRELRVRSMAAACMGIVVGMIGSSLLSGSLLTVFPNNVFFWVLVSCVLVGFQSRSTAEDAEPTPELRRPGRQGQPAFARYGNGAPRPPEPWNSPIR